METFRSLVDVIDELDVVSPAPVSLKCKVVRRKAGRKIRKNPNAGRRRKLDDNPQHIRYSIMAEERRRIKDEKRIRIQTERCTETQRGCSEPSYRVVQSIHPKSSDINDLELRFIPPSDSKQWIQLLATSELLLQISGSARLRKSFRNLRLNQGGKLMKIGELKDWFHTYKRKPL